MTGPMISWLRSTIEGDKAVAEAATPVATEGECHSAYRCWHDFDGTWVNPADQVHIARHDPRDTISRCEAELALLAEAEKAIAEAKDMGYWSVAEGEVHGAANAWRGMLETLAAGYKHRPGYGSWVPSAATPGLED